MSGWSKEEIFRRNSQLARLADSRKEIMMKDRQKARLELNELTAKLIANDPPIVKADKEQFLRRIRELEAITGCQVSGYNSDDFGRIGGELRWYLPPLLRPGMYAGLQGDRTKEEWQADALAAYLRPTEPVFDHDTGERIDVV